MVKRKLQALNYRSANDFNIDDPKQVRIVVLWLEDQVIRHYKIEDRGGLRNVDSPDWSKAFEKYCSDIECPISPTNQLECLEWIAGFAVRLEYFDDPDKYSQQLSEDLINKKSEAPTVTSANPLDNLDFQSEEFRNGVNNLASLLKISPHPDHLVTLEAICTVITNALNEKDIRKEGTPFPIMESDLGFDLKDYILNQAAKVLRLLYIHDLRDLQTKINECIVAVQSITADPKTDTKLGKVGF